MCQDEAHKKIPFPPPWAIDACCKKHKDYGQSCRENNIKNPLFKGEKEEK